MRKESMKKQIKTLSSITDKSQRNESIYRMALIGLPENRIAELLQIDIETFKQLKKDDPSLKMALTTGQKASNTPLHKDILEYIMKIVNEGYTYEEEVAAYDRVNKTWHKTLVKKFKPSDAWAMSQYLSLRRDKKWGDNKKWWQFWK